jgi:hypothetical protein
MTMVQSGFFQLRESLSGLSKEDLALRLYWEQDFTIDGTSVRFQQYNSSWASDVDLQPGQFLFPIHLASQADSPARPVDLAVTVIHHPLHWFAPSNGRAVREHLERTSDIVLTGHEHVHDRARLERHTGASVHYIAGDVLQEAADQDRSAFHILQFDVTQRQFRQYRFAWSDDHYRQSTSTDWAPFQRNPLVVANRFGNTADFERYLADAGADFSHPRRAVLNLDDLYVYPDLRRLGEHADLLHKRPAKRIPSDEVLDHLLQRERVLISGQAQAGKTALTKMLYADLKRRKGVIPILLDGQAIRGNGDKLRRVCEEAFVRQYGPASLDRFRQLGTAQRAIIVDDFHKCTLGAVGRTSVISDLCSYAASVICTVDDLYLLNLMASPAAMQAGGFSAFETFEISELGYVLRGRLIEKWHGIGREQQTSDADFRLGVREAENTVGRMLNLLPSVPITILTILQTLEATSSTQPKTGGSFAYLYEALVTAALSRIGSGVADIDTRYAYMSHLAHAMFGTSRRALSRDELEAASAAYANEVRLRFPVDQEVAALVNARILERRGEDIIFRYRYVYCYFVARYFRDHAQTEAVVATTLRRLCDSLHVEDYANIVTFYLYLTRDVDLIRYLIQTSRRVYGDQRPARLDDDVDFVNQLFKEMVPLEVNDDVDQNREQHRRNMDEAVASGDAVDVVEAEVPYSDGLADLLKINFAFKTLVVLGQVLRSFPGSLRGDIKAEIAKESYLLGMRTISAFLGMASTNRDELRAHFVSVIKERRKDLTAAMDQLKEADEILIWLTIACTHGVIKRVANSLGTEQLRETYQEVLVELGDSLPAALIDAAIRLDHFATPPLAVVEGLAERSRKNYFAQRVLRDLVWNFLYLYHIEDQRVRQKLGQLVGVRSSTAKLLDNPQKRER